MRKGLLILILMSGLSFQALPQEIFSENTSAERKLRFAASQHEIISTLLKAGKFSEVLPEFRKILALNLEGENEKPVVQEAWIVLEHLREAGRYELAHQIVDESLKELEADQSQFYLLMLKGKIFQDEGRIEEAIGMFHRAQELNPAK